MKKIIFSLLFATIVCYPPVVYSMSYSLNDLFNKNDIDAIYKNIISHYDINKHDTYYDVNLDSFDYVKKEYNKCKNYLNKVIKQNTRYSSKDAYNNFKELIVIGGFLKNMCSLNATTGTVLFCGNEVFTYFNKYDNNPPEIIRFFIELKNIGIISGNIKDFIEKFNMTIDYIDGLILK